MSTESAPLFDDDQLATETSEIADIRQRAEQKRKQRAKFLTNLDSFSQDFEAKAISEEQKRREIEDRDKRLLQEQLESTSTKFASVPPASVIDLGNSDDLPPPKNSFIPEKLIPKPIVEESASQPFPQVVSKDIDNLTQSLLAATSTVPVKASPIVPMGKDAHEEELSVPARIGSDKKKAETSITKPSGVKIVDDHESDEEGTGDISQPNLTHFLTKEERKALSPEEKVHWRAMQADLTVKRKDFHGAVTYAFGGIFSWQMYGSAEALDELGKEYTEYLMRCQWGTSWDNLQPWIAARRYREFDRLDLEIMPKLPEKDFFRFLEADVIAKRRRAIQDYVSVIVSKMPTILKSSIMDEFLGIGERVATIRAQLARQEQEIHSTEVPTLVASSNPAPVGERSLSTNYETGNVLDLNEEISSEEDLVIVTEDIAETVRRQHDPPPFDEDGLGRLEESIRELIGLLRQANAKELGKGGSIRRLLISCTKRWPQLRATCELSALVDFSLIPRGLQAEEDIVRCLNEYRSLVAAFTLS